MGNQQSSEKTNNIQEDPDIVNMKFHKVIDYIAAKFITQASFKDLQNLQKKEYCNKMIILTSKIIEKFFNRREIEYMAQKTKDGKLLENPKVYKEPVSYFKKDDLEKLDISVPLRKQRMCKGIAKFYIKIAHLFSSIATTINPEYTYQLDGEEITVSLKNKDTIPNNATILKTKYKNNLCSSRINSVKPIQNNENGVILKARNCFMNQKNNSTETKNLLDEPGIPELKQLYFDEYDLDTGEFNKISKKGQEIFMNDLEKFYVAFTGGKRFPNKYGIIVKNIHYMDKNRIFSLFSEMTNNKVVDINIKNKNVYIQFKDTETRDKILQQNKIELGDVEATIKKWEITKFSDIHLEDFHNQKICTNKDSFWLKSYKGAPTDKLFQNYAKHISDMVKRSQQAEKSLLTIIKQLFSFWEDTEKQEKILTINPELSEDLLDTLIIKAREDILNIYINCEKDFQTALELFNTIAEVTTANTNKRKKQNLMTQQEELLTSDFSKKEKDSSDEIKLPAEETKIELPAEETKIELPAEETKTDLPSKKIRALLSPEEKKIQLQNLEKQLNEHYSILNNIEINEQKI